MKTLSLLLLAAIALFFAACSNPLLVTFDEESETMVAKSLNPGATVIDLIAGKKRVVGTVTVSATGTMLEVTYELRRGWALSETNLEVAADLADIPQTGKGRLDPRRFGNATVHAKGINEYTYLISTSDPQFAVDAQLYIAAHAKVSDRGRPKSAWAREKKGKRSHGRNRISYFAYTPPVQSPEIEIAGLWWNLSLTEDPTLCEIDNSSVNYPDLMYPVNPVTAEILSYDNDTNEAILVWTSHDPLWVGLFFKSAWAEPTDVGFTSWASENFETIEEAEAAPWNAYGPIEYIPWIDTAG
jgi:hypothetical protein